MLSLFARLVAWFRQPTSIAGLSVIAGAASGVASGQMTLSAAMPLLVGGIVGIALPDNSGAVKLAETIVSDIEQIESVATTTTTATTTTSAPPGPTLVK